MIRYIHQFQIYACILYWIFFLLQLLYEFQYYYSNCSYSISSKLLFPFLDALLVANDDGDGDAYLMSTIMNSG